MLFADDFVGMSDTPEGLQLQIDAAKKFTDKWRLSANVQKSAVMVCNENKEEPAETFEIRVQTPLAISWEVGGGLFQEAAQIEGLISSVTSICVSSSSDAAARS
ncbi:unnamed protein product [Ectocarpus sp. CCAP 1310/34]|nr:unnamed protein product [Ectocarpus sp. CCAP 1310/34]